MRSTTRQGTLFASLTVGAAVAALALGGTSAMAGDGAGSRDLSFATGKGLSGETPPIAALSMAEQRDGKLLVGGYFTTYRGGNAPGIVRINRRGSQDSSFDPGQGPDGPPLSFVPLPSGKIIVGGAFTSWDGADVPWNLVRIKSDGSIDKTFRSRGFNQQVQAVARLRGGGLLVGGQFTAYGRTKTPGGLVRLNRNGRLDKSFTAPAVTPAPSVQTIVALPDGKVLIGGEFRKYGGTKRSGIARINADGSLDTTFNPGGGFRSRDRATNGVNTIVPFDRGYLVGGSFTHYKKRKANNIALVAEDGSRISRFRQRAGLDGQVNALVVQKDDKVIALGNFEHYRGAKAAGIVRIDPLGRADTSFDSGSGFSGAVATGVLSSSGQLRVGGFFNRYNKVPANGIVGIRTTARR